MPLTDQLRAARIRRIRVLIDQKLHPERHPGLFSMATVGHLAALLVATSIAASTVQLVAGSWAPRWLTVTLISVAIYVAHEFVGWVRDRFRSADAGLNGGPDDLDQMSDRELAVLEDDLLLENEFSTEGRVTLPRLLLYFMMFVSLGVWSYGYSLLLPSAELGIFNIPIFLVILGLAVGTARFAWRLVGWPVRHAVRIVLSHWVFVIYVFAVMYGWA